MSDWKFRSTFYAVGRDLQRDPEAWHAAIASPDTDFSEDRSAVLILQNEHAGCSLLIEPVGARFALSWEIREAAVHRAVVPCVHASRMQVFEYTHHDDPVPSGSLVDRATAGHLVRLFLEQPDELPDVVRWVDRSDIAWPEGRVALQQLDFDVEAHELARGLLGHVLISEIDGELTSGRIVELEVYGGIDDAACHADRGTPTPRTQTMFGEPGHAYVYRIYGMHDCLNVVAPRGTAGKPSAILIRALEPLSGEATMASRRGLDLEKQRRQLLSGPAKICQALGVDRGLDGHPLWASPLCIAPGITLADDEIARTPRVGLNATTCGASAKFLWRYVAVGSPWLSRR